MPDRPPLTPGADEPTRQATDEAAGTPPPAASAAAATEAQAKQAKAAVPRVDRDRAVSPARYRKPGAAPDSFLAAFIACLALCAGVTAAFLVFALP